MERSIEKMALDGGRLCFDFVNTVHSRKEPASEVHEYLNSYQALILWSDKTDMIPAERQKKLKALAVENPSQAEAVLQKVIRIREVMYHLFSAMAAGVEPGKKTLQHFNAAIRQMLSRLKFTIGTHQAALSWQNDRLELEEPLWHVLKSAFEVLVQEDTDRIKECGHCGWLFLDETKNNKRKWCNPHSCGSIVKAKNYYWRKKAKE